MRLRRANCVGTFAVWLALAGLASLLLQSATGSIGGLWLHVVAYAGIAASFFLVPVVWLWLLRERRDLPYHRVFVLLGAFGVAHGTTHLLKIWDHSRGTHRHAELRFESVVVAAPNAMVVVDQEGRIRYVNAQTGATQAIYNLLTNALKFTRPGEPPRIEIGPFRMNEGPRAGVGIVVRDRGPGIEPGCEDRIFGLFQRGVGREIEGTGAGLAIVREVARRFGGEAWVQPRAGGGSEFMVTFGVPDTGASVQEESVECAMS